MEHTNYILMIDGKSKGLFNVSFFSPLENKCVESFIQDAEKFGNNHYVLKEISSELNKEELIRLFEFSEISSKYFKKEGEEYEFIRNIPKECVDRVLKLIPSALIFTEERFSK